jgi:hypothetical protein
MKDKMNRITMQFKFAMFLYHKYRDSKDRAVRLHARQRYEAAKRRMDDVFNRKQKNDMFSI